MHGKRIVIAMMAAVMTTGCGLLPAAPGTTNVEHPPAYVNVVQSDKVHVRLVPQATSSAARNQHPAAFQPSQVRALVGALRLRVDADQAVGLTSRRRMSTLVSGLSKAFTQAGPKQDVAFVVFREGGGLLTGTRHVTSGRMFYQKQTLNIIFSAFDKKVSPFRNFTSESFTYGNRAQASDANTQALLPAAAWHYRGERRDWIQMPATKAAIAAATAAAPAIIESTETGQSSSSFEYGPAAAGHKALDGTLEPTTQPPKQAETDATPQAATMPPPTVGNGWARIEERLTQLKRLRDKKLITADDYQAKKDALLQQLP